MTSSYGKALLDIKNCFVKKLFLTKEFNEDIAEKGRSRFVLKCPINEASFYLVDITIRKKDKE